MSEYRKTYPGDLYFVTLTVSGWLDVFNRPLYNDEIIKNLVYCQEKEGLEIYAYVLMSSHLHMVARRDSENDLTELLGRFKSTTAKKLLKLIENNPGESRKEWMMYMFRHFAQANNQFSQHHFWQYKNHPVELYTNKVIDQKVDYIHDNPVKAGLVTAPEYYPYSSACLESPLKVLAL